jgi:Glycosyl hydrolase family 59
MSIILQTLRQTLNMRGFGRVKVVAADSLAVADDMIVRDILHDPELYDAVDIVGFVVQPCANFSVLGLF